MNCSLVTTNEKTLSVGTTVIEPGRGAPSFVQENDTVRYCTPSSDREQENVTELLMYGTSPGLKEKPMLGGSTVGGGGGGIKGGQVGRGRERRRERVNELHR